MHLAHFKKIITLFMASVLAMLTLPALAADAITTHEFMVDSAESGVRIFVRNKHRDDLTHFSANKIVLLVHGATYPSETVYDLNLPGGSWLEVLASQGYDAYLMDVRGYGRSTRPVSMHEPAENNPPFADTADARSDVSAVVDFILARRKVEKINLIGWSWGTSIMGGYTTTHNDKVNKLVLYAPVWNFNAAPPISGNGAYRSVAKDSARKRGLRGIRLKALAVGRDFYVRPDDLVAFCEQVAESKVAKSLAAPSCKQDGDKLRSALHERGLI